MNQQCSKVGRQVHHDFASAVTAINHGLRDADLEHIYKVARGFKGQLKNTFLILDDSYDKGRGLKRWAEDDLGENLLAKRPFAYHGSGL